jgi:signal peptidase I
MNIKPVEQSLPSLIISQEGKPQPPLVISLPTYETPVQTSLETPQVVQTTVLPVYGADLQSSSPTTTAAVVAATAATAVPAAEPTATSVASVAAVEPTATSVASVAAAEPTTTVMPVEEQMTTEVPAARSVTTKRPRVSPRRSTKTDTKRVFLIALRDVFIAVALLAILLQFFSPTVVREHSMENTLKENEILYIAKKAYWFGSPQHGDIVIFHTALVDQSGTEKNLVKRIIGLPGDRISISGGMVIRNGETLDEPYLKSEGVSGTMSEVVVPADSYFVLGDNREVSNDSRNAALGFVGKDQLRGKVVFRIFPLNEFRTF